MSRIALIAPDPESACTYYRTTLPLRHCAPVLAAEGIELGIPTPWFAFDDAAAVVFYRLMRAKYLPVVLTALTAGQPIWWDTDDDFGALPTWNPAHAKLDPLDRLGWRQCLTLATGITVSTRPLVEALGRPDRTRVLPNLVDLDDWDTPRLEHRRLTVLWAGSDTHQEDHRVIVPALRAARRRHRDRLDVLFAGSCPDYIRDDPEIGAVHLGGCPLWAYPAMMRRIAPDVVLAPLAVDDDARGFNRAKSAIKWIEGTLSGGAVIAQRLDPYADAIDHGETGWLCDDADDWSETLLAALDSGRARADVVANAMDAVAERHSWQASAAREPWLDWFRTLVWREAQCSA